MIKFILMKTKKIIALILSLFIIPLFLLTIQLVVKENIHYYESFNLYVQPIILGFVIDILCILTLSLIYLCNYLIN